MGKTRVDRDSAFGTETEIFRSIDLVKKHCNLGMDG